MNPARSLARMTCLPSTSSAKAWVASAVVVAGEQRRHQLHQGQHRHRAEEVQPHHLLRPAGGHGQLHDGDGRRVGGEDGVVGHHLVEGGEDLELERLRLRHRLQHQLAVGQVGEVGGEPDAGQGRHRPRRRTACPCAWPGPATCRCGPSRRPPRRRRPPARSRRGRPGRTPRRCPSP